MNSKNSDQKGHIFIDPIRSVTIKEIFRKAGEDGWSGRKIYKWLKDTNFKARSGKPLTLSNIYTILNNHFYYGAFEYPKLSGNWYQGKHQPLITKTLFDDVQKQLHSQIKIQSKNKEFAFTKILSCGGCGSGVTAQEKYKTLKDGSVAKYVYYGCTKSKDHNCKEGYIEERELIKQLTDIIELIDLDEYGIKAKLKNEIERHKRFHTKIMGKNDEDYRVKDADIRNYAKYLLEEGSIFEKRDLLSCVKNKTSLKNKRVVLSN